MNRIKRIGFVSLYMTVLLSAAACAGKETSVAESSTEVSMSEESSAAASGTKESVGANAPVSRDTDKATELLADMTKAIEMQYPDQTFTDIKEGEAEISPLLFGGAYVYSGRQSSDGFKYIAAVCTTSENPLESMTCGNGEGVPGFMVNQFNNGRLLLLEESGDGSSGLSYLYGILQQGEAGIRYLTEAGERGATLIPPSDQPFLKVSMVKAGLSITEFIVLSEEERDRLLKGTPVSEEEIWVDAIALCNSRDELSAVWNGGANPVTEEMVKTAVEKCDFDTPSLKDIEGIVKAQLTSYFYGESRTEILENRDDLERLSAMLAKGKYTDTQYDRNYGGFLQLTKQNGELITLQLAVEDGGFILGNAVFCELTGEETREIWSLFSMTEGFRRYGNKISLRMENTVVTPEDENLTFTLINNTGNSIHYSLSPVLYKKQEDSSVEKWKQIDTIGGFCGTNSETVKDETSLFIPWKGIFELEGPGTYKIEIQVMPETDLRFAISGKFDLK